MMRIQTWGLFHSNSFTVPFRVMVFSWSNMAKEWWAKAGTAKVAATRAATPKVLPFIAESPPLFLNIGRAGSADRATVRKRRSDELPAARAVPQRVNVDSDTVARFETVRLPADLDLAGR